jgi:hypothetical protein
MAKLVVTTPEPLYVGLLSKARLNGELWPKGYMNANPNGGSMSEDVCPKEFLPRIDTVWGGLRLKQDPIIGKLCRVISIHFNAARVVGEKKLWTTAVLNRLASPQLQFPDNCEFHPPTNALDVCEFVFWDNTEKTDLAFESFHHWVEAGWLEFLHSQVGLIVAKNENYIRAEMDGGDLVYACPVSGEMRDFSAAGENGFYGMPAP